MKNDNMHPKFLADTGLKNGYRNSSKRTMVLRKWREDNQMSPYLTNCHQCGGSWCVEFEKLEDGRYRYYCQKCYHTHYVSQVDGIAILSF